MRGGGWALRPEHPLSESIVGAFAHAPLERRERRVRRLEAKLRRRYELLERERVELDVRERVVAERERALAASERPARRAGTVLRQSGPWSLDALERLVATSDAPQAQIEEARLTLAYLRAYARVEGRLPTSFDNLVATFFEPLSA